jgi:hypothetical protein
MEIPLQTIDVWEVEPSPAPRDLFSALRGILNEHDVIVMGAYEPTDALANALIDAGGVRHTELTHFYTSFEMNRSEHPNGCAYEFTFSDETVSKILAISPEILRQKDVDSFYDSFIAYRPGTPRIPLISFHDASCGGTLYLSGLFQEEELKGVLSTLGASAKSILNPVLDFMKNEK